MLQMCRSALIFSFFATILGFVFYNHFIKTHTVKWSSSEPVFEIVTFFDKESGRFRFARSENKQSLLSGLKVQDNESMISIISIPAVETIKNQ